MTLEDFYDKVGGDCADVCERLGGRDIVISIIRMLQNDRHYEKCKQALIAGDADEAFRAVHALKGICLNLDIRSITEPAIELTEILREGQRDMDKVPAAFGKLQSSYLDTLDALREMKE